jgi:hypothetical protein
VPIWDSDSAAFVPGAQSGGGGSSADASTTVKGLSKLSVAPAVSTNPIAVGTNDSRLTADQAAGTASPRTLGTGATQAAAGNHTHSALTADQAAGTASVRTLGTGATQAAAGNHAHAASAISYTPGGSVAATNVQAAIAEVAAEAGSSGATPGLKGWIDATNNTIQNIIDHDTTDQTTQLATLYAGVENDSLIWFPPDMTVVGRHAPGKPIKLIGGGRGPNGTVFRPPTSNSTDAKHIDVFGVTGEVVIEGIRFEGNSSTSDNIVRCINGGSQFTQHRLEVRKCWIRNYRQASAPVHGYGAAAAYAWPAAEFIFEENIVEDCVHGPVFDTPSGASKCQDNIFFSSTNDIFVWEILVTSGGAPNTGSYDGPMLVQGNDCIADTRDPENNGNTGSAIQVYNVRGVRVKGNMTRNCDGPGIRIGAGAWGGLVEGNDVQCDNWHGIYIETNIGDNANPALGNTFIAEGTWTSDIAKQRGVRVVNNNTHHCTNGCGIEISYSPGTICIGNEVHHNGTEGIKCDSERVQIKKNTVYNNWRHATATPSGGGTMAEAQIRTWGRANKIVGNEIWDNFTTKTSNYGIAVTNDTHTIEKNGISDYVTAAVWQEGNGTTNIVRRNTGTPTTVASAATLTLPPEPQGEYMVVTGSTGITSITQSWEGRKVTLVWGSSATFDVTDGGNIKLTSSITAHDVDDTLTLLAVGANWHEVARSPN